MRILLPLFALHREAVINNKERDVWDAASKATNNKNVHMQILWLNYRVGQRFQRGKPEEEGGAFVLFLNRERERERKWVRVRGSMNESVFSFLPSSYLYMREKSAIIDFVSSVTHLEWLGIGDPFISLRIKTLGKVKLILR